MPRQRILVIDDEPSIASLIQLRLENADYDVHVEHTGSGGLDYASQHRVNLVVLDLLLPDVDGLAVCHRLRQLYEPVHIPILMVTALSQMQDKHKGFAAGADAYLTKPFDSAELLKTITILLQNPSAN